MREILFRGKSKPGGEWVEGFLVDAQHIGNWVVAHPVDPETVGQFTGFYDSTKWEELTPEEQQAFLHQPDGWENTPDVWPGKRIFEGDILEWDAREWGSEFREVAEWNYSLLAGRKHDWHEWCKVIGNIHDNPELLEVK